VNVNVLTEENLNVLRPCCKWVGREKASFSHNFLQARPNFVLQLQNLHSKLRVKHHATNDLNLLRERKNRVPQKENLGTIFISRRKNNQKIAMNSPTTTKGT